MAKALLLTIVVALVALPLVAASDANPRRGLKKALLGIFLFNFFYLFLVRFVLPHLE